MVQQKQGRVKPDSKQNKGGVNLNTDASLEKEADEAGVKAAQAKTAEIKGKGSGVQRKSRGDDGGFKSYMDVIGVVSSKYTVNMGKGGTTERVSSLDIPTSTDSASWLKLFKSQNFNDQAALALTLKICNEDIAVGDYEIDKSTYHIERKVSKTEKSALLKALVNPTGELSTLDFDGQSLIWLEDYNVTLDGPLSKFITNNYIEIEKMFDKSENSAYDAASALASETTVSGVNNKEIKGFQKGRNGQKRGMAIYGEKMPPVTEALVSSAYMRAISYVGEMFDSYFTNSPLQTVEPIQNSIEIIQGALTGYEGKIDSVNKRNQAIFDVFWSLVPLNGAKFTSVIAGNAYSIFISNMGTTIKEGMISAPVNDRKTLTQSFNKAVSIMSQKLQDLGDEAPAGAIRAIENNIEVFDKINSVKF